MEASYESVSFIQGSEFDLVTRRTGCQWDIQIFGNTDKRPASFSTDDMKKLRNFLTAEIEVLAEKRLTEIDPVWRACKWIDYFDCVEGISFNDVESLVVYLDALNAEDLDKHQQGLRYYWSCIDKDVAVL